MADLGKGLESSSMSESTRSQPAPRHSEQRVDFGKHRGKTYGEVLRSDPSYCDWASRENSEASSPGLRALARYLVNARR